MIATTRTLAVVRNAALRQAAKAAFPDLRFTVRNGRDGWAAVSWVDGPTEHAVTTVLDQVPVHPDGTGRWGYYTYRSFTPPLVAVAYLRTRDAGAFFYSATDCAGNPIQAGHPPADVQVLARWACPYMQLDAADINEAELARGLALLAVADVDPAAPAPRYGSRELSRMTQRVAAALFHHADVLAALAADPAATTR